MILQNIKIGNRLLYTFLLISIIISAAAVFITIKVGSIKEMNTSLFHKNLTSIDLLLEADRDVYQSRLALLQGISKPNLIKEITPEVRDNLAQVKERYGKYAEIYKVKHNQKFKKQDSIFNLHFPGLILISDSILSFLEVRNTVDAQSLYESVYAIHFDNLRESLNQSTEILLANAELESSLVEEASKSVIESTLISMLVFLMILIVSGVLITRSITIPLMQLVAYSVKIAKGDLSMNIEVTGKDEISKVMTSYKEMTSKLKEVIGNIRNHSFELNSASSTLAAVSNTTAQSSNEQAAFGRANRFID